MKKYLLFVVLTLFTVVFLTACQPACEHEEVIDAGKSATCTTEGMTEGKHCNLCNKVLVEQKSISATGHDIVSIPAVSATCTTEGTTEGSKCSTCGIVTKAPTKVSALGHSTTSGTCSRCGKSLGNWELSYYVDEFNEKTSNAYIYTKEIIEGVFSNSATTDSRLYVTIAVDKEDISIFLYEYGSHQVKNYSSRSRQEYEILLKTEDGKKYEIRGLIYPGGDRVYIAEAFRDTVLSALKSGGKISFYLVESDYTISEYLFSVETTNFADKYAILE